MGNAKIISDINASCATAEMLYLTLFFAGRICVTILISARVSCSVC